MVRTHRMPTQQVKLVARLEPKEVQQLVEEMLTGSCECRTRNDIGLLLRPPDPGTGPGLVVPLERRGPGSSV